MATATKPMALDETLQRIAVAQEAQVAEANLIYLPIASGLTDTVELAPQTAIYRCTPTPSGTTVTVPTPDTSDIPVAAAYYCFEMEVAVDDDAETLVGPQSPAAFSAETAYEIGDKCVYDGAVWECATAHEGAWDAEDFTELPGHPVAWEWLDDMDLPTSGFAGKTVHIAVRLDSAARTCLASVWRVA